MRWSQSACILEAASCVTPCPGHLSHGMSRPLPDAAHVTVRSTCTTQKHVGILEMHLKQMLVSLQAALYICSGREQVRHCASLWSCIVTRSLITVHRLLRQLR